jgi:hypothetical protein
MGAILLGSAGSLPENDESTNSIPVPESLPTDPTVLTEGVGIGVPDHGTHIPAGGLTDQVLAKLSGDDYSLKWTTPSSSGSSYTFEHGLTESGGTVKLGGALNNLQSVSITGNGTNHIFFGSTGNLLGAFQVWSSEGVRIGYDTGNNYISITQANTQLFGMAYYSADFSGSYTTRSLVDKAYVDGLLGTSLWTDAGGYLYPTTNNRSIKINTSGVASEGRVHYVYTEGGTTHFIAGTVRSGGIVYYRINADLSLTDYTIQIKTDKTLQIGKVTTFEEVASYDGDKSGSFADHSLVTKKWVTDNFVAI